MPTYKLPEILSEIQERFHLPQDGAATQALRKKVETVCKKIEVKKGNRTVSLWEKAKRQQKSGGKPRYVFTEYERQLIFDNPGIWTYATAKRENLGDSKSVKELEAAKNEAAKRNRAIQAQMGDLTPEEYYEKRFMQTIEDEEGIMFEIHREFSSIKLEIMVKAIFSIFFEPIDERKLYEDLMAQEAPRAADGQTRLVTADSIMAEQRLKDPLNYCKRKDKPTP